MAGTLWALGFDAERLELTNNNPVPVVENVGTKVNGAVSFSIAGEGALIYVRGEVASEAQRTLVWVDREGREEPLSLPPRAYTRVAVSPDGARAAVVIEEPDNNDVWTSELARGTLIKVTTDPANDDAPLWTPDGRQLVFSSNRDGLVGLFRKMADGRGDVEQLVTLEGVLTVSAYDWSPDGTELLFNARTPEHSFDVNVLSMEGERSWTPLLQTVVNEGSPALSPDGSWVAYNSGSSHECMHGSGQWQVRHAVIEVADVIRCCPEAIGFMNDELSQAHS